MKASEYGPWVDITTLDTNQNLQHSGSGSFSDLLQKIEPWWANAHLDYVVVEGRWHNETKWKIKADRAPKTWALEVWVWGADGSLDFYRRGCSPDKLSQKLIRVYEECINGGNNGWHL